MDGTRVCNMVPTVKGSPGKSGENQDQGKSGNLKVPGAEVNKHAEKFLKCCMQIVQQFKKIFPLASLADYLYLYF